MYAVVWKRCGTIWLFSSTSLTYRICTAAQWGFCPRFRRRRRFQIQLKKMSWFQESNQYQDRIKSLLKLPRSWLSYRSWALKLRAQVELFRNQWRDLGYFVPRQKMPVNPWASFMIMIKNGRQKSEDHLGTMLVAMAYHICHSVLKYRVTITFLDSLLLLKIAMGLVSIDRLVDLLENA